MSEALAVAHQASREELARVTARAVLDQWKQVDPTAVVRSWGYLLERVTAIVMAGQLTAATQSEAYLAMLLDDAPLYRVIPQAFAESVPDGRPQQQPLSLPIGTVLGALNGGASEAAAMAQGAAFLDMLVRTVVFDTGRMSDQVAMAARPEVTGYVRVVEKGACPRCIVLAGRIYAWTSSFRRHPRCGCTMRPVTRTQRPEPVDSQDVFSSMSPADRRKTFGEAATKAIEAGADISRVVNARQGMATVEMFGQQVKATYAGTGRKNKVPRLMPETIFELAEDRDHAIRLLKKNGYIY